MPRISSVSTFLTLPPAGLTLAGLLLTGCSLSPTAAPTPQAGSAIHGSVHGGSQPITGALVYLYAANTTGYGGNGIAASSSNASVSLLTATVLVNSAGYSGVDGNGHYYVTSDSNGDFNITGDYDCTPNSQVYLYALGGNAGAGPNEDAGLMSILGNCPSSGNFLAEYPTVYINEVTTVAAAYAMAGFATDATHVSSSGTALAQTGIANAFANAANLVSIVSGTSLATTPAGNGTVPQTEINTLGNILAACVDTSPSFSAVVCNTLFGAALSAGASGTAPTDTASAAINIAHYPGANVATLFGLPSPVSPYPATGYTQPNDFTIGIQFAGNLGAYSGPIAIDGSGNVWQANNVQDYRAQTQQATLSEFTPSGALVAGSPFAGDGHHTSFMMAIDGSGNIWLGDTDYFTPGLSKFTSSGAAVAGSPFATGSFNTFGVTVDATGNVWLGGGYTLPVFNSSGSQIAGSPFYGYGPIQEGYGPVSMDGSGNVWAAEIYTLSKFTSSGGTVVGAPFYGTGPGIYGMTTGNSEAIAIDSSGKVWVPCSFDSVNVFTSSGAEAPGSPFYVPGGNASLAIDGAGNVWFAGGSPDGLIELSNSGTVLSAILGGAFGIGTPAIDGSGDIWSAEGTGLVELIGVSAPVVTPVVANLIAPYSAPASKP